MSNFEELGLDDITEEYLLEQAEEMGAALGVDTRQGSIYMDAAQGHILRTAKFFDDLRTVRDLVAEDTCCEEVLLEKAAIRNLYPHEAVPSKWKYVYEGNPPTEGAVVFVSDYFFTLHLDENGEYYLEAQTAGAETNTLIPGSLAIPQIDVSGLRVSKLGEMISAGQEAEDIEDFRERYREKVSGPAENGNYQHYKTWCEECEGVGRARILPLWNGANTVKGVLIDQEGLPVSQAVAGIVQEHVDPGAQGLGMGAANLGAHFTAAPAGKKDIEVSLRVELAAGYTADAAKKDIEKVVTDYLKELALDTERGSAVVRYAYLGAGIALLDSVADYSNLLLNGSAGNITVLETDVGVLKDVTIEGV